MLRIIGGEKRGARLFTPEGLDTRPLRDRVREALFNILQGRLAGRHVLDVFGGTGAVGLEAVSRGAASALFIEANPVAGRVIARNIQKLGYESRTRLVLGDAPQCLRKVEPPPGGFDFVFLMPPYHSGLAQDALVELDGLLSEDAVAVMEIHADEDATPPQGWEAVDDRLYGVTRLVFLGRG